jgi:hypothetical protein
MNATIRHPLLRQDEDAETQGGGDESQLGEEEAEAQYHALFRLLQVFFFQEAESIEGEEEDEEEGGEEGCVDRLRAKAIASLRPRGYSTDMLDYRGPYLSLLFLEATAVIRQSADRSDPSATGHAAAIVRQHMVGRTVAVAGGVGLGSVCVYANRGSCRAVVHYDTSIYTVFIFYSTAYYRTYK